MIKTLQFFFHLMKSNKFKSIDLIEGEYKFVIENAHNFINFDLNSSFFIKIKIK